MSARDELAVFRRASTILIAALVIVALYAAREVLIPFTLAALLSVLLSPAVRMAERLRIGRIGAVFLIVLCSFSAIGGLGWLMVSQGTGLAQEVPNYRHRVIAKAHGLYHLLPQFLRSPPVGGYLGAEVSPPASMQRTIPTVPTDATAATTKPAEPVKVEVVRQSDPLEMIAKIAMPALHPMIVLGMSAVFLFFFLVHREDLRDRILRVCGPERIQATTAALTDSEVRIARFFLAQGVANIVVGTAIGVGLYFIGVPRAPLWGLVACVLRLVPFVGPIIAAIIPAIISAAVHEGWLQPIAVIAWTILVDTMSANFLEPWLFSSRVGASPTAIITSLMFWGWLWGGIGLLMATPITVCLIVLGKHVPGFRIFYILLGNEPVLEPKLRLYQRLLSMDKTEAIELVREFAEKLSSIEVYDTLLIPALAQLQLDWHAGLVDEKRIDSARHVVQELMAEFVKASEDALHRDENTQARLLFVPDRGCFDDLLPALIRQVAPSLCDVAGDVRPGVLASEIAERAGRLDCECVVMCAIEPMNVNHILHVHRRVQLANPDCATHVGLFSISGRGRSFQKKLSRLPGMFVWTTLAELSSGVMTCVAGQKVRAVSGDAAESYGGQRSENTNGARVVRV